MQIKQDLQIMQTCFVSDKSITMCVILIFKQTNKLHVFTEYKSEIIHLLVGRPENTYRLVVLQNILQHFQNGERDKINIRVSRPYNALNTTENNSRIRVYSVNNSKIRVYSAK